MDLVSSSAAGDVIVECMLAHGHGKDKDKSKGKEKGKTARHHSYCARVYTERLSRSSPFFGTLFHPTKFHEGRALSDRRRELSRRVVPGGNGNNDSNGSNGGSGGDDDAINDTTLADVRAEELPRVTVALPPLSAKSDMRELLRTFFALLQWGDEDNEHDGDDRDDDDDDDDHGDHDERPGMKQLRELASTFVTRPISFRANLVVLADWFGARAVLERVLAVPIPCAWPPSVQAQTQNRHELLPASSMLLRELTPLSVEKELRLRQYLYVALFLRDKAAVLLLTHRIIIRGSIEWRRGEPPGTAGIDRPIWWHMPEGIEGRIHPALRP